MKAAQKEQAEEVVRRLLHNPDAVPVTDPVGEAQRLAGALRHAVDVLGQAVDEEGVQSESSRTVLAAWVQVVRELRQLLVDMKRLGIAEHQVEVEAARVKLIAVAVGRMLDVLELTAEQREAAMRVLLVELRARAELEDGAAS